jgi:hypothetical protein
MLSKYEYSDIAVPYTKDGYREHITHRNHCIHLIGYGATLYSSETMVNGWYNKRAVCYLLRYCTTGSTGRDSSDSFYRQYPRSISSGDLFIGDW